MSFHVTFSYFQSANKRTTFAFSGVIESTVPKYILVVLFLWTDIKCFVHKVVWNIFTWLLLRGYTNAKDGKALCCELNERLLSHRDHFTKPQQEKFHSTLNKHFQIDHNITWNLLNFPCQHCEATAWWFYLEDSNNIFLLQMTKFPFNLDIIV